MRPRATFALPLLLAGALSTQASVAMQDPSPPGEIEERSITARGGLDPFDARDDEELLAIFDEADSLFSSAQQSDSIEVFDGLIARLESDHQTEYLSRGLLEILILSRARRAEAHFNLGQAGDADQDLLRLLELDPGWTMDSDLVSPKLVQLFDRLRRKAVGSLLLQVEPGDVVVLVDGRPFEVGQGVQPVLAGDHTVHVSRAGFETLETQVQVAAGATAAMDAKLERVSAVIRLQARPPGAEVTVDGWPAEVRRSARGEESETDASADAELLEIEAILPGRHELAFELAGFRTLRLGVDVAALEDYELAPIELEPSRGEIELTGVPIGARITLDGRPAEAAPEIGDTRRLTLAPGNHTVTVLLPDVGVFSHSASVEDREVTRVRVELQPTIAFLGVLGGDRLEAGTLAKRLTAGFASSELWIWNDRSQDASELATKLGLEVDTLRRLGSDTSVGDHDWSMIRDRISSVDDASLYLLAVLGDDLYATTADLWLWSPAPWPPLPVARGISLAGDQALEDFIAIFHRPVVNRRAWLGARLIDSDAAAGPVVSQVLPGGPAEEVGIQPGEEILQLNRQPVTTSAELGALLGELGAGARTTIRIAKPGDLREETIELGESFELVSLNGTDVLEPVLAARLSIELQRREPSLPLWVLQLQQAAILLRTSAFDEAVPVLRTLAAPERPGIGKATGDYWLGQTLMSIDASNYAEAARAALDRALATPEARLGHDDGPLLAPRARARLRAVQ